MLSTHFTKPNFRLISLFLVGTAFLLSTPVLAQSPAPAQSTEPVIHLEEISEINDVDLSGLATLSGSANSSLQFVREHVNNVAPTGSFDVGPTMYKIRANQGDLIRRSIQVTSRSEVPTSYTIKAEDYEGSQDPSQSHIILDEGSSEYGAKHWVTPGIQNFSLELGDRITFDVDINIPADADPGEHYVTVLIVRQPMPKQTSTGSQIDITSRIGVNFLIDVNGEIEKGGHLEDFAVEQNFFKGANPLFKNWVRKSPFNFLITYRNTGSSHLTPGGTIEVRNIFGQIKTVIDPEALRKPIPTQDFLTVNGFNVLRNAVRTAKVQSRTNTQKLNLVFGPYKANLKIANGLGQEEEATIVFWYLPTLGVVTCLLILAILAIVIARFCLKGKKRRQSVAAAPPAESKKFKNA